MNTDRITRKVRVHQCSVGTKILAAVLCLTFETVQAPPATEICKTTELSTPGVNKLCECGLVAQACNQPYIFYNFPYSKCVNTTGSGNEMCVDGVLYVEYVSGACESSISVLGVGACALAILADFGVAIEGIAACATGVLTIPCVAILSALYAGTVSACNYCNLHTCAPLMSSLVYHTVTPRQAAGCACP